MLPTGHIAAGYLTAKVLLKELPYHFTARQSAELVAIGTFFGFAPDLDFFYSFYKAHSFTRLKEGDNHRSYVSHAPIIWLVAGLLIFFLSQSDFAKTFGLLVWLGSWSHFLLDSIQYGVQWLWPFNTRLYAMFPVAKDKLDAHMSALRNDRGFFRYWFDWTKGYIRHLTISFTLEIIVIIIALILFSK